MSEAAAAAAEYRSSHRRWAFLAAALIIAVLPHVFTGSYWHTNLTVCAINVLLALGLDFILGYAGQLNLGQSAFYGLGAYVSTLLITKFGFPFWGAFVAGVAFAGLSGVFLALFAVRLRGHYLAIASLGFAVIVHQILLNWISLTQGPLGIYAIPPPPAIAIPGLPAISFRNPVALFYLIAGFTLLVYFLLDQLVRSPIGETLTAIREDEISASSLGINATAWKVFAFGVGAAVGGAAGCFYAPFVGTLVPDAFFITESFTILSMVIVGGMGTLIGPVFGADPAHAAARALARHRRPAPRRLWRRAHARRAVHAGRARAGLEADPRQAHRRARVAAMTVLLRAHGLHKSFGGVRAVRDVSFERGGRLRLCHHRPERRRQIHDAQPDQRGLPAECRHAELRWRRSRRPARSSPRAARNRAHLPEDPVVQAALRARERRGGISHPS